MSMPADLLPLPTMPYDERPDELPLDVEECRTALWESGGNISKAATKLKIGSSRLRKFVKNSPYLTREVNESREVLQDIAESNAYDALTDTSDPGRRDSMSRFILSNLGSERGYNGGKKGGGNSNVLNIGKLSISWADGQAFSDSGKIIDAD